jgi:hypothetical protein
MLFTRLNTAGKHHKTFACNYFGVRCYIDRPRGLETLGVNAQQYGSLLTPIITVAKKTNSTVWELQDIVKILKA